MIFAFEVVASPLTYLLYFSKIKIAQNLFVITPLQKNVKMHLIKNKRNYMGFLISEECKSKAPHKKSSIIQKPINLPFNKGPEITISLTKTSIVIKFSRKQKIMIFFTSVHISNFRLKIIEINSYTFR